MLFGKNDDGSCDKIVIESLQNVFGGAASSERPEGQEPFIKISEPKDGNITVILMQLCEMSQAYQAKITMDARGWEKRFEGAPKEITVHPEWNPVETFTALRYKL